MSVTLPPEDSPGSEHRRVVGTRRSFLRWTGIAAVGTAAVAVGAKILTSGGSGGSASVSDVALPTPVGTLPSQARSLANTPGLDVPGLTPLITPNDEFFRIDTAFNVPAVDPTTWRLDFKGKVKEPFSISYDELMALPQVEAPVTLACVSNRVGGTLIGTAVWQGVELRTLLDRAGVESSAQQIVGRSVDGFTAGFPTEAAFDGRTALVAVGMNGAPLPRQHGFPARLVVEGLYGYVSSTKWLQSIELAGWEDFDAYWIQRGWSKTGPIKPSSRIDVPRSGLRPPAGTVTIAGVAWAPDSGVASVEVRIDDVWRKASLGESLSGGVWRQWYLDWDATPGEHEIAVRCTSADGVVQSGIENPDAVDGYTGWESRTITVV